MSLKKMEKALWICGSIKYDYSYTVSNSELSIDYTDEAVHDVKYTFTLKDDILTLISVQGTITIGEEYKLVKENK